MAALTPGLLDEALAARRESVALRARAEWTRAAARLLERRAAADRVVAGLESGRARHLRDFATVWHAPDAELYRTLVLAEPARCAGGPPLVLLRGGGGP